MITRETYIEDLVREHPESVNILMKYGVVCIKCGEPVWGTLGEKMERLGIDDPEAIIDALNKMTS